MSNADLRSEPMLRAVPEENGRKLLGAVVLRSKIGEDEKRAIYRGRHTRLGLDVAVECYEAPRGVEGAELLERLRRSAQLASSIVHPNLRRVIDVGVRYGVAYIVLEYVPGDTVRTRVEKLGPRPSGEAVTIVLHAARGVAAAHAEGIAHGSIGPHGVRVTPDGKVKVADLGFARRLPLHPGQEVDKQPLSADVVALGALLAFLVMGKSLPMAEATRLRGEHPEIAGWVIELLELCLGDGDGPRPKDAAALVRELEAKIGVESSLADPLAVLPEPPDPDLLAELRDAPPVPPTAPARAERPASAERFERSERTPRERAREEARREPPRARPARPSLESSFGESDLPELLSPDHSRSHAAPRTPPRAAPRPPAPIVRESQRPASPPPPTAPRPDSRGGVELRRGSRAPWWSLPTAPRRRRAAIAAMLLVLGAGLAAIPLWNALRPSEAEREKAALAAFDQLLARLRRAEIEFGSGADPMDSYRQIEAIRRDLARWTGAPDKRQFVAFRAEEVAKPVQAALLAREMQRLSVRLEPHSLGAAPIPAAAGSKQAIGSRRLELSWSKSEFLPGVELAAVSATGGEKIAATILDRGTRQFGQLSLPTDGSFGLQLVRRGEGWPDHSYAFTVEVDTQPPVIVLEAPAEGARLELASGAKIAVRGRAEDLGGTKSVGLRWRSPQGAELAQPAALEGGKFQAELTPEMLVSGTYELQILAEDRLGNLRREKRSVLVVALPSAPDPAASKQAPQLELEVPVAARTAPSATPQTPAAELPTSAFPSVAQSSAETVAPSAPGSLAPSSPATAGDRAARAEDRPAVPGPAREGVRIATPVIDLPLPREGASEAPSLELEGPASRTENAPARAAAESSAELVRPAPSEAPSELTPKPAPEVVLEKPAPVGERAIPAAERPIVEPAPRSLGDVKLREIEVPELAGSKPFDLAFLKHCGELSAEIERDAETNLPVNLTLQALDLELCLVKPPAKGEFLMGAYPNASSAVEVARGDLPRKVKLDEPFYLGVLEVRERDWERVMGGPGTRARYEPATDRPAGNLSFADVQLFLERANAKLEEDGLLELPDEVRWEYAARGPEPRLFPWGNELEPQRAHLATTSFAPAGSLPLGRSLHCGALDLAGNAKEWCRGRTIDGREERPVLRGGSYLDPLRLATTFHREQPALDGAQPQFGFRVMLRVRTAR
ncbi:MAG: SUMF1/EgtB/PvdO family nonheme iron enzyme [Planctomycetes bacterium]|nr:SUMF1/EgtB/PvdO family nonheme iron enzyme [Planctomycetota bacterium]